MSNHPYRSVDLIALREELEREIREIAASGADGSTHECDVRHGQIGQIESVIQLIEDRAGAEADRRHAAFVAEHIIVIDVKD